MPPKAAPGANTFGMPPAAAHPGSINGKPAGNGPPSGTKAPGFPRADVSSCGRDKRRSPVVSGERSV